MYTNRQFGNTLIEMLLMMAAIVGVIFVIMATARYTTSGQQTYAAVENLQAIINGINRVYATSVKTTSAPYVAISVATIGPALDPGVYQATPMPTITNAYGGQVFIVPGNSFGTLGDSYSVGFDGVPANACPDFVGKIVGTSLQVAMGSGWHFILTPGGAMPDAASIATACNTWAQSGKTLVWVVGL